MEYENGLMKAEPPIACRECDLLHRVRPLPQGGVARCRRCGAVLYTNRPQSLEQTLALAIAGLILFAIANAFPFLAIKAEGLVQETTLISGAKALYQQGWHFLAALVATTTLLAPLIEIGCLLYLLLPLRFGRLAWKATGVLRFMRALQPWQMMEIFMLGILVAMVKLSSMATMVTGVAVYAFGALIVVLAAAATVFDPRRIWDLVAVKR
jgi:paraquat-inducible protein A